MELCVSIFVCASSFRACIIVNNRSTGLNGHLRLYTDFLSERLIFVYQQPHHGMKERVSKPHIPHAPTLLENAVYNEWQFQALVTGNRTKKGI